MPPDIDASGMGPSRRSHPHGPPLLDRVRVAHKFPGVQARMQPSDFPAPFGHGSGSPRRWPTPMQKLVLNRPRVPLRTRSASETDHRLSAGPGLLSRRGRDLPGYWAVLFVRAMVEHPAGSDPPLPLPLL
jgi:hypothetical protein